MLVKKIKTPTIGLSQNFTLHVSEISDKSETGAENHVSVQAESSHFFPFKKVLYRRGQNVTFFGKDVTKNVTS